MKWDSINEKWLDMGLPDAYNIAGGPAGHIYATAAPVIPGGQTLYRWEGGKKWTVVPGPSGKGTKKITVGDKGILYQNNDYKEIWADEGEAARRCDKEAQRLAEEAKEANKDRIRIMAENLLAAKKKKEELERKEREKKEQARLDRLAMLARKEEEREKRREQREIERAARKKREEEEEKKREAA